MKRELRLLFSLLLILSGFLLDVYSVQASLVSSAWVKLKWNELQITTSEGVSYTWIDDPESDYRFHYTEVGATLGDDYEWSSLEGTTAWETELKMKKWDGFNKAKAVSKEKVIKASIRFDDDHLLRPVEAYVYRQGYFEVSGDGWITFSMPYTAHIELASSPAARVVLYASLDLWTDDANNKEEDFMKFTMIRSFTEDGAGSWTKNGWLTVTLPVEDGQVIGFGAEVDVLAPVPLPGAVGLLGAGLFFLGIRRKFLARK